MLSVLYSPHIYYSDYKNFYLEFYLVSYTNVKDFILNKKFYFIKPTYYSNTPTDLVCFRIMLNYLHLLKRKGDVFTFKFVPFDHLHPFHTFPHLPPLATTDLFTISMNLFLGVCLCFVFRFHI